MANGIRQTTTGVVDTEGGVAQTVVSAATTYIDSFDDQDLSEYSGDTGGFAFSTTTTQTGADASLTDADDSDAEILSTSGLPNYPAQGDTWEWWFRTDTTGSGNFQRAWNYFGVQDANNMYICRFGPDDGAMAIRKEEAGSTSFINDTAVTASFFSANTWYRNTMEWDDGSGFDGTAGAMRWTIEDADSTSTQECTVTGSNADTTWTSGGIGWRKNKFNGENYWWDEAVLL